MSLAKSPVTIEDLKYTTDELQKFSDSSHNDRELNDREKGFIQQMYEQVWIFKNKPSELQAKWLYRLYYKHIEGDEDEYEQWEREHF